MSNHLSIATVTATLFNILDLGKEEAGVAITTLPPDKARESNATGSQLNIFLYHTAVSAAWRNMPPPHEVRPGESAHPPLALTLYYLITAFGTNNSEISAHRVLGRAMSNLHDHPILGPDEFVDADAELADQNLHQQIERVRITPEPLSLDDMYKLWSSFQTQYRPSAAYQVSLVLLDSERAAKAPLPVLARGRDDDGVSAQANAVAPYPTITAIHPSGAQPAARLTETVTIDGHHLDGDQVEVSFRHRLAEPFALTPEPGGSDSQLVVTLPSELPDDHNWWSGIYTVSVLVHRSGEPTRTSNELPLAVAPRITSIAPNPIDLAVTEDLVIGCEPAVTAEQAPRLLLGDRVLEAQDLAFPTDSLTFSAANIAAGAYFLRLRIDGIDSVLIDYSHTPPIFDSSQQVTVIAP